VTGTTLYIYTNPHDATGGVIYDIIEESRERTMSGPSSTINRYVNRIETSIGTGPQWFEELYVTDSGSGTGTGDKFIRTNRGDSYQAGCSYDIVKNDTVTLSQGQVVKIDSATDNGVILTTISGSDTSTATTCARSSTTANCRVCRRGRAQFLLDAAATRGYLCQTSTATAGSVGCYATTATTSTGFFGYLKSSATGAVLAAGSRGL
jgi:hypothetical protein